MDSEIKAWLYDVLNALLEIESFLSESGLDFNFYQSDLRTKRAVERNIEIIGEAINRILKRDTAVTLTHARQYVDVRNRIIHGYDSVSDQIMWGIIISYLPLLETEVRMLLDE
jgi:uncharacterized protein with HEPN domain